MAVVNTVTGLSKRFSEVNNNPLEKIKNICLPPGLQALLSGDFSGGEAVISGKGGVVTMPE